MFKNIKWEPIISLSVIEFALTLAQWGILILLFPSLMSIVWILGSEIAIAVYIGFQIGKRCSPNAIDHIYIYLFGNLLLEFLLFHQIPDQIDGWGWIIADQIIEFSFMYLGMLIYKNRHERY